MSNGKVELYFIDVSNVVSGYCWTEPMGRIYNDRASSSVVIISPTDNRPLVNIGRLDRSAPADHNDHVMKNEEKTLITVPLLYSAAGTFIGQIIKKISFLVIAR